MPNFSANKRINKIIDNVYIIPEGGMLDSNMYLIRNQNDESMLIDTGNGITFDKSIDAMKKLDNFSINTIKKIIQTHCHVDHILGLYKFLKKISPKPQLIASEIEAEYIENGDKKRILPIGENLVRAMVSSVSKILSGAGIHPVEVDIKLKQGDHVKFGDFDFITYLTPGHTPGGICLYETDHQILFSGDTVFTRGSFGRVDFPGGSGSQLVASLKKLSELDVKILLPGHMNPVYKNGSKHINLAYNIASDYL
ncbi:MAG: MBL fold metallo-hydrolase [Candidatus Lokiarchaeota archaeon]|nr:MBL fold metallo-hydrolase [Candidatus Lokiarchaeota archaeon]